MFKKINSCILVALIAITALSGCSENEATVSAIKKPQINICYNDTQYGSEWINEITAAFKVKHPGITVNLKSNSLIDNDAAKLLEKDACDYDVIFMKNTNWQYFAQKGYLEDLTALYDEKTDNNPTSINDSIVTDCKPLCKYNNKYYVLPLNDSVPGFIYNENLFLKNNWEFPTNTEELNLLLNDIKKAQIIPFAWGGKNIEEWDGPVKSWWLQNESDVELKDYFDMKSADVYNQKGRLEALVEFASLIFKGQNSSENVIQEDLKKAQSDFLAGKAAFLVGGSWSVASMKGQIPDGFNLMFSKVPVIQGAQHPENGLKILENIAVIPSGSQNKEYAKDFLEFMNTEDMLELFTVLTSEPRPFYYDAEKAQGLSEFGKKVIEIWKNPNNRYMSSDNPLYYDIFSDWPAKGAPYLTIYSGLQTPAEAVQENFNYVKDNWEEAVKSLKN